MKCAQKKEKTVERNKKGLDRASVVRDGRIDGFADGWHGHRALRNCLAFPQGTEYFAMVVMSLVRPVDCIT